MSRSYLALLLLLIQCSFSVQSFLDSLTHINLPIPQIPEFKDQELALGYDEDAVMTIGEIIKKNGYPFEAHNVTTEDGYILTVHRIPRGKDCKSKVNPILVVMGHGLICNSDLFVITGPQYALGYIIADQCYDVWMLNDRGTTHSRKHVTLNADDDAEFWKFSFDEYAKYDLPNALDYILDKTNTKKVKYIGHSQGGNNILALIAARPEYNEKFEVAVLLAPAAFLQNMSDVAVRIFSALEVCYQAISDYVGTFDFIGKRGLLGTANEFICQYFPDSVCGLGLSITCGQNPSMVPKGKWKAISGHFPAGSSLKSWVHLAQLEQTGIFRRFHYSSDEKNIQVYGTSQPPVYDLSKVTVPTALFSGNQDLLVSPKDVKILSTKLQNVIDLYEMPRKDWSHTDFLFGVDIPEILAPKILEYLAKYDDGVHNDNDVHPQYSS